MNPDVNKCAITGCACGGLTDERDCHDTGFRLGTDEFSIPVFVSPYVPDPGYFISGDWIGKVPIVKKTRAELSELYREP